MVKKKLLYSDAVTNYDLDVQNTLNFWLQTQERYDACSLRNTPTPKKQSNKPKQTFYLYKNRKQQFILTQRIPTHMRLTPSLELICEKY